MDETMYEKASDAPWNQTSDGTPYYRGNEPSASQIEWEYQQVMRGGLPCYRLCHPGDHCEGCMWDDARCEDLNDEPGYEDCDLFPPMSCRG